MTDAKTVAELAAKGTQGEWRYEKFNSCQITAWDKFGFRSSFIGHLYKGRRRSADAQRIANVPAMEALIAEQEGHIEYMETSLENATFSYKELEAENARLREALEPFADAADEMDDEGYDEDNQAPVTVAQCRVARAALMEKDDE